MNNIEIIIPYTNENHSYPLLCFCCAHIGNYMHDNLILIK